MLLFPLTLRSLKTLHKYKHYNNDIKLNVIFLNNNNYFAFEKSESEEGYTKFERVISHGNCRHQTPGFQISETLPHLIIILLVGAIIPPFAVKEAVS